MNILIIGAGGREQALAWKFAQESRVEKIFLAPGNAGSDKLAKAENIALETIPELLAFAQQNAIDLTFVGAEALLAEGIVDQFQAEGLKIFGANQQAAELESSKRFAKAFMKKYGVKTADYESFTELAAALAYLEKCNYPTVVKASGLAAGKGVIICHNQAEAEQAVREMMEDQRFGAAGSEIVIEAFLTGFECSILSFCDGKTIVPMQSAKDHKKIEEYDHGENTGGMGVISPHPLFTPELAAAFEKDILAPTLAGIQAEKMDFAGVIFFGLMINDTGVYLLEYNMRMGDPETQAVLPLLASSLLDAVEAALEKRLTPDIFQWRDEHSCCVVVASGGYPGKFATNLPVHIFPSAEDWATLFFAGVKAKTYPASENLNFNAYLTAGGRVLNLVGQGKTLEIARLKAYAAVAQVHFDNMTYRRDIGHDRR